MEYGKVTVFIVDFIRQKGQTFEEVDESRLGFLKYLDDKFLLREVSYWRNGQLIHVEVHDETKVEIIHKFIANFNNEVIC